MRSRLNTSDPSASHIEMLKSILECAQNPEQLNEHPWVESAIVLDVVQKDPALLRLKSGERLLVVIGELFAQMLPSLPPRRGLRLDTKWGEFGLLAARYFAPLKFGVPFPPTLRDAWGRIDQSILLFVFGEVDGSLTNEQKSLYSLVGGEPEAAAPSTLSDWHKKGVQRLANVICEKETYLRRVGSDAADPGGKKELESARKSRRPFIGKAVLFAVISLFLVVLMLTGAKAYQIYVLAGKVKQDAQALQMALPTSPDLQSLKQVSELLPSMNRDLDSLKTEVEPFLWLGPWLRWVPLYGGDLAQAGSLLDLAQHLTLSAQKAEAAFAPFLESSSGNKPSSLADITNLLTQARPQLLEAQVEFQKARQARDQIKTDQLSKKVGDLIVQRIDPGMGWMQDGLSLAIEIPSVLGAGSEGPKTYLLLAQNEDELRPSGGFITAVGKLVLDRGRMVDLSFEDSGYLDNWSMPYPLAPWPLSQYMNSRVLILRDANWFPDFPTASLYVRQLYAYAHQNSANGVIAFDQHFLVMLLEGLGPVNIDGVSYPITATNVVDYMRTAKTPPAGQPLPADWNRKAFIGNLANAMLQKVMNGDSSEWGALSAVLVKALQERHLIVKMDESGTESVLEKRGWNGSLQSTQGDFLTVIDSNIGFNKTNAVVDTVLAYDVNLTDMSVPSSELLVSHTNHAAADVPCVQWTVDFQVNGDYNYPVDRCYWDYIRIYLPQATRLLSATPQAIPDAWMILNRHVPPSVDVLDEVLTGLQGFGTMVVVPGGQTQNTGMRFALPAGRVLSQDANQVFTYRLTIRKQPGTLAVPLTIRIHLPGNAKLETTSPDWTVEGSNIMLQTDLKVDLQLEIRFGIH